jgi:hypothetical protein
MENKRTLIKYLVLATAVLTLLYIIYNPTPKDPDQEYTVTIDKYTSKDGTLCKAYTFINPQKDITFLTQFSSFDKVNDSVCTQNLASIQHVYLRVEAKYKDISLYRSDVEIPTDSAQYKFVMDNEDLNCCAAIAAFKAKLDM